MHAVLMCLLLLCGAWAPVSMVYAAEEIAPAVHLLILGTAQDAGLPQAGCERVHCQSAWNDPARRIGATSLAVIDAPGAQKILFEATPNLPEQLHRLEMAAPQSEFKLTGVFLTHAHIGHYTGLMHFGHEAAGARDVPVYAMPRMAEFLRRNGPWGQLVDKRNIELHALNAGVATRLGALAIEPVRVPHRDEYSETVGFFIRGPQRTALFVPDIDRWSDWDRNLPELLHAVDYALLDATFYSADELPGRDLSQIPHPLVTHTMEMLADSPAQLRNKIWFIHMNHSNPLLNPDSEASHRVRRAGFNVARVGLKLPL